MLDSRPVVSWVNLVEVYHRIERDHGRDTADDTLTALRRKLSPDLPGTARMIDAARLTARASIALADCFAATTAAAHGLVLLTGDPELVDLADPPAWSRISAFADRESAPPGRLNIPRPALLSHHLPRRRRSR